MNIIDFSDKRRPKGTRSKARPSWLHAAGIVPEPEEKVSTDFTTKASPVIIPGDRIKLVKSLKLSKGTIPVSTAGTVLQTDGIVHVVKFSNNVVVEVNDSEIAIVGSNRSKASSHFHIPDRKRVVAPNKMANRYILFKLADHLTKLAQQSGMVAPTIKLLRSSYNIDQSVKTADFLINYIDDHNLTYTVKASFTSKDSQLITPETFVTSSGLIVPFSKEAVEKLSEGRVFEKAELPEVHNYMHYRKEDPVRSRTAGFNGRSVRAQVRGVHSDLTKEIMANVLESDPEGTSQPPLEEEFTPYMDQKPAKNSGAEFKFTPKNFRDIDTGIPSMEDLGDSTIQRDPDTFSKEYQTMEGEDEEKTKRERMDKETYPDTVARFDPYRVIKIN
jgi:hypothetical protein